VALVEGRDAACHQIVMDLFLAGHSVLAICDQVIAEAFHQIGHLWECGDVEVYQERRAVEICFGVLLEMKAALPEPSSTAELALGGTPEGDTYRLPTQMVELVLRELGWRAISLGSSLPLASIQAAVERHHPQLVWLSASHLEDEARFLNGYGELYANLPSETAIVVGGRGLTEHVRREMKYATFCDNLTHLQTFLASWRPSSR
jgi:methanogenic corrinoid protein MtbC1